MLIPSSVSLLFSNRGIIIIQPYKECIILSQQDVKKTVEHILESDVVGVMSTVRNNRPHARYMTFMNRDLTLYTVTNKETDKVEELADNPFTHILLGYEGNGFGDEYVEYEGKTNIHDSKEIKEALWNPHMKNWFSGPDDPKLVVLKITPLQINLMNKTSAETKSLSL